MRIVQYIETNRYSEGCAAPQLWATNLCPEIIAKHTGVSTAMFKKREHRIILIMLFKYVLSNNKSMLPKRGKKKYMVLKMTNAPICNAYSRQQIIRTYTRTVIRNRHCEHSEAIQEPVIANIVRQSSNPSLRT
jgi:hypothetical protein